MHGWQCTSQSSQCAGPTEWLSCHQHCSAGGAAISNQQCSASSEHYDRVQWLGLALTFGLPAVRNVTASSHPGKCISCIHVCAVERYISRAAEVQRSPSSCAEAYGRRVRLPPGGRAVVRKLLPVLRPQALVTPDAASQLHVSATCASCCTGRMAGWTMMHIAVWESLFSLLLPTRRTRRALAESIGC